MILIGSRALQHYIPNLGRVVHDWDFMMSTRELNEFALKYGQYLIKTVKDVTLYEIPNVGVVEIFCMTGWMPSDYILYETCEDMIATPFGGALVPSLDILFEMKKATAEFIKEPKHDHDVRLMEVECVEFGKQYSEFYDMRRAEIKARLEKETKVKYDFFHKYHIPEYIKHDYLHEVIVDLIGQALPTYKILKHCCITGLKGEAEYITNFSRANFFEIEKLWIDYKQKIKEKGGFSSDFYGIIFKLREDYKKGINVATI